MGSEVGRREVAGCVGVSMCTRNGMVLLRETVLQAKRSAPALLRGVFKAEWNMFDSSNVF